MNFRELIGTEGRLWTDLSGIAAEAVSEILGWTVSVTVVDAGLALI